MPIPQHQFETNAGAPCASCVVYFWEAGTSTLQDTFSNETLATANPNPITLNSSGRNPAGGIFLSASAYKVELRTSGGTVLLTQDSVRAVPTTNVSLDVTGTAGEALSAGDVVYMSDASGSCGASAGRYYKADADLACASTTAKFVGMVQSACASGLTTCSVRVQGRITALSGLTAGTEYYASATAGALTSSAPSNARRIGVADSTTAILIAPNPGNTIPSLTVTGNTTLGDAVADTVTIAGMLTNTSLRVADSNASHAVVITPGSNITADRIWTVTFGDAAITTTFTATTAGTFLRSDATNWAGSTLVLPNAATANQICYASASNTVACGNAGLTFDGTNFVTTGDVSFGGGDLIATADAAIRRSTTDAADNGSAGIAGGGAGASEARGAFGIWYGNEHSTQAGDLNLAVGNIAGAALQFTNSAGAAMVLQDGADGSIAFTSSEGNPNWTFNSTHATTGGIAIQESATSRVLLYYDVSNDVHLEGATAGADVSIDTAGTGSVKSSTIYSQTDAGAANLVILATGEILRSTSSARYKTNIGDLGDWHWFLRLKPVAFNSLSAPTGRRYGGFLAEDVVAHGPRGPDGLPLFAGLDAEGRPDDVAYPHLTAVAQQGLVDHETRLQKQLDLFAGIEARLKALEAENATLRTQLRNLQPSGADMVAVPAGVRP